MVSYERVSWKVLIKSQHVQCQKVQYHRVHAQSLVLINNLIQSPLHV